MELQLTPKEASDRLKNKFTTWLGVPILLWGLFMIVCKVYDAITGKCPDCHFAIGTEILPTIILGYALFTAKDSLITGMVGLILPRKK
jgi:hypothetical protein